MVVPSSTILALIWGATCKESNTFSYIKPVTLCCLAHCVCTDLMQPLVSLAAGRELTETWWNVPEAHIAVLWLKEAVHKTSMRDGIEEEWEYWKIIKLNSSTLMIKPMLWNSCERCIKCNIFVQKPFQKRAVVEVPSWLQYKNHAALLCFPRPAWSQPSFGVSYTGTLHSLGTYSPGIQNLLSPIWQRISFIEHLSNPLDIIYNCMCCHTYAHSYTFIHQQRCQPCNATASSLGAVRVRCVAHRHLNTWQGVNLGELPVN